MQEAISGFGRPSLAGRVPCDGRIAWLTMTLVFFGLGCAGRGAGDPFVDPGDARLNIEVINTGFQDATLHLVWPGQRIRLGFVTGSNREDFRIAWARSELIQIEIDLLAGDTCTTIPMWADPGDFILLEITNQIMRDPDCVPGRARR